jgi:phenylalanyl-tRNA synthetase beta chain
MRQSLIFTGLESLRHNINRKQKNLKFFEFGRTYKSIEGEYKDNNVLALFMSGSQTDRNWRGQNDNVAFHDLSSAVNKILGNFNIADHTSMPTVNGAFEYGLDLGVNGKTLASIGKLKHKLAASVQVSQPVFYAELSWNTLIRFSGKKLLYKPVSKFPEVKRDLSLVIDKSVSFDQIRMLAERENKKLLKRINVFSVYEGENIGSDKKSYALSFILRDEFKTLNDKQIDRVMNGLIKSFEDNIGAIIRK